MPRKPSTATEFDRYWQAFAAKHTAAEVPAGAMSVKDYAARFGVSPSSAEAVLSNAVLHGEMTRQVIPTMTRVGIRHTVYFLPVVKGHC